MDSTECWLYSHPRHKPQGPHQKAVFDVWGPRMGGMSCYCTVAEKPVLRSCFLKTCSGERLLLHCSFFHPITQELKTAEGTRYWNMKMQNLLPKILSYNAVRFQQWHFIHHLFLFLFWFFFSATAKPDLGSKNIKGQKEGKKTPKQQPPNHWKHTSQFQEISYWVSRTCISLRCLKLKQYLETAKL